MGFPASVTLSIYCLPPSIHKMRIPKMMRLTFFMKPGYSASRTVFRIVAIRIIPTTEIPVNFIPSSMPAATKDRMLS